MESGPAANRQRRLGGFVEQLNVFDPRRRRVCFQLGRFRRAPPTKVPEECSPAMISAAAAGIDRRFRSSNPPSNARRKPSCEDSEFQVRFGKTDEPGNRCRPSPRRAVADQV